MRLLEWGREGEGVRTDARGHFVLPSLESDSVRVYIRCVAPILDRTQVYGPFRVPVGSGEDVVLEILPNSCERIGIPPRPREYAGHYSGGFEWSSFTPCEGLPDTGRWYAFPWNRISIERFPEDGRGPWPHVPEVDGYPLYFLRLRGILLGPGPFGHMGTSPFTMVVDSVEEVRAPSDRDCR